MPESDGLWSQEDFAQELEKYTEKVMDLFPDEIDSTLVLCVLGSLSGKIIAFRSDNCDEVLDNFIGCIKTDVEKFRPYAVTYKSAKIQETNDET